MVTFIHLCFLWNVEVSMDLEISCLFKFELRGEVKILNVVEEINVRERGQE